MTPDKFPWHDPEMAEAKAREAFAWWEWMRWIYNLAMLLVGVSGIVLAGGNFYLWQIIFIGIYGVIANCFYFLGFITEMIDQHYFGGNIRLHRIRLGLFILGTVFSAFVTFFGTLTFFDPMWFDPVP
ncbi:MAG: hypothetical protein U0176_12580 [Bacteroidia bacterium]